MLLLQPPMTHKILWIFSPVVCAKIHKEIYDSQPHLQFFTTFRARNAKNPILEGLHRITATSVRNSPKCQYYPELYRLGLYGSSIYLNESGPEAFLRQLRQS